MEIKYDLMPFLRTYLNDFRKTDEILSYLKSRGVEINIRQFQHFVEDYNKNFETNVFCIVGTNKGYKLETDKNVIRRSQLDKIKKLASGIKNAKGVLQALDGKDQLSLLDEYCFKIDNFADTYQVCEQETLFEGLNYYGKIQP